jgi:hypothetical protein
LPGDWLIYGSAYSSGSSVELQMPSSSSTDIVLTRTYEGVTHYSNTIHVLLGADAAIDGEAEIWVGDYYSVELLHDT